MTSTRRLPTVGEVKDRLRAANPPPEPKPDSNVKAAEALDRFGDPYGKLISRLATKAIVATAKRRNAELTITSAFAPVVIPIAKRHVPTAMLGGIFGALADKVATAIDAELATLGINETARVAVDLESRLASVTVTIAATHAEPAARPEPPPAPKAELHQSPEATLSTIAEASKGNDHALRACFETILSSFPRDAFVGYFGRSFAEMQAFHNGRLAFPRTEALQVVKSALRAVIRTKTLLIKAPTSRDKLVKALADLS